VEMICENKLKDLFILGHEYVNMLSYFIPFVD